MPQHKNLYQIGHKIYNCGRLYLGHQNLKLTLSNLCLGVEKKSPKEIMHFN